jgi:hypothetical protein
VSWVSFSTRRTAHLSFGWRGEDRFRVARGPDDLWATYDPDNVRASPRRFAGMTTPEKGERIKEAIDRGREEGARPLNRP